MACALALLAVSAPAAAADTTPTDTPRAVTKLDAVNVIISKPDDPQSSTGSAYVLTEKELEKFESTNINSILRSVPGVYLREEDGLGTFPNIGIRAGGSGRSGRISIMEDGIPAAMSPYANTSAYYFPTAGRMRGIEVLKGPEVLLYGPQTTSGAINLLSTGIPNEPAGFLNAEVGRYGTRKIHAHAGGTFGQWGVLAETYQRETDGFHTYNGSNRGTGSDTREYMAKLRWRSESAARFAQQVEAKIFTGQEDADVSYLGVTDADFRANPNRRYRLGELQRMDRRRNSASVRHTIAFTNDSVLTTTAYWTDTQRYYDRLNQVNGVALGGIINTVNNGGPGAVLLNDILNGRANTTNANGVRYGHNHQDFIAKGLQFEWTNHVTTGPVQHEIITGARLHHDSAQNGNTRIGNTIYQQINGDLVKQSTSVVTPSEGNARAYSVWLADRITLGSLTLLPVLRHENIRSRTNLALAETDLTRNRLTKTTVGLGANYAITRDWTVLGGVHQGFAPPGSGVAMGTKGEESTNYEAGVRYRAGKLGVDAIGFYSDYTNAMRNCLVANPCPNGAVDGTQQTGSKKVYGLELGAFAEAYRSGNLVVPVRAAYTYTDGKYTKDSDVATGVRNNDVLEYTPKHIGSVQIGLEVARLRTYAALSYSGDACVTNTCGRSGADTRYLKTQSLVTLDLSTTYAVNPKLDLYARADNVFDTQKITNRGPDGARGNMGRYLGVGVRAKF